jgi:hypothetical protein
MESTGRLSNTITLSVRVDQETAKEFSEKGALAVTFGCVVHSRDTRDGYIFLGQDVPKERYFPSSLIPLRFEAPFVYQVYYDDETHIHIWLTVRSGLMNECPSLRSCREFVLNVGESYALVVSKHQEGSVEIALVDGISNEEV